MSDAIQVIAEEGEACEWFAVRWDLKELKAVDPDLHARLVEQQRMFRDAQEAGDLEEICIQGDATIRGWRAAGRRMEDNEIERAKQVFTGATVTSVREKNRD